MASVPGNERVNLLKAYESEHEPYFVIGREVYLLFRDSIRNSKLASNLQKVDAASTVRNWKTVNKLYELGMEMEDSANEN